MRVTRIPGDFNDIGDRPCRVYLNEVPVEDWIVADDFRRVVETPNGARFGSVRIDMVKGVQIPDDVVIMIDGEVIKREPVAEPIPSDSHPIPSNPEPIRAPQPPSRKQKRGR